MTDGLIVRARLERLCAAQLLALPAVDGDTLSASGYEAYGRLSPAFALPRGLTAVHNEDFFVEVGCPSPHPCPFS